MLTEHVGTGDAVDRIVANYHDLLDNYPTVEGVIIDVRQNSGGYLVDMPLVLGKLVNEETLMCYTRQKGGIGRLDYTPWVPEMLKPTERVRELDVPIVVMADMNSISMAEMTTRAVQTLPNGCFIGEQTYGGQGTLINSNSGFNMFYGGYFSNNAMRVYTTMTMTKGVDGVIAEGKGLVPDIEVPFDGEKVLIPSWNGPCSISAPESDRKGTPMTSGGDALACLSSFLACSDRLSANVLPPPLPQ